MTKQHSDIVDATEMPTGKNRVGFEARRLAARLLGLVVDEGHSLAALCDNASGNAGYRALITKDRAMVRAILTTCLRNRGAILTVMKKVMDRPEPKRARDLTHNLHVAAAQILFMELPDSAAVNLAVAAIAANRNTQRFKGFANAVLRRIGREKEELLKNTVPTAPVMPQWLQRQVRTDFGRENLEAMEAMILLEPYLDISLNGAHSSENWETKLEATKLVTGSLRLTTDTPVHKLEGYKRGAWWVQNAAAAIPAKLLGDVSGLEVADLCAAPGGKSAQLASNGANVTMVDNSETRLARLVENFERLELEGNVVCANLLDWKPAKQFDCVLLDAPCSSTGTLRRHPDVMWSKSPEEVKKLAKLQRQMLKKAIELTRPGGRIIFATCSLAKAEGEDVFSQMLKDNKQVKALPVLPQELGGLSGIINGQGAVRCLPNHMALDPKRLGGLDGFFAGRLERL
ncbi:16S rRNA (cytosine(967)-C(5))-methyltransferase [hydrothermal vent metagenome]|uniref:16S rRNA (Cytosine(967)-C(5))-methyltransferase n=1 Tax=hydrothermal vent metagenome TaxID=652676 RepID=A0A3B1BS30_9ZZZZ